MKIQKLSEAIILQSMEDLWDGSHRAESMEFFFGEGFHTCAQIAGLNSAEKLKVLNLVKGILNITEPANVREAEKRAFNGRAGRAAYGPSHILPETAIHG